MGCSHSTPLVQEFTCCLVFTHAVHSLLLALYVLILLKDHYINFLKVVHHRENILLVTGSEWIS